MATGKFGDLRSLVHATPAEQSWIALCAEVRRWPAAQFEEEYKLYVLHALERWPDALRVMPRDWVSHMLNGRGQSWHITALVRALRLEGQADGELGLRVQRLCAQDWTSLRALEIAFPLSAEHWRAIAGTAWFKRLTALKLDLYGWDEELVEAVFLEAPPLHLESLTLRMGQASRSIGSGLGLHVWERLHTLHIEQGSASPAFWRSVADAFPALRALRAYDAMRWPESFEALAAACWLPGLRSLDINLYPRLNPPRDEEYDVYRGDYGDDYYDEIDEMDTDDGELNLDIDSWRHVLSNPRLNGLRCLRLQDRLYEEVINAIAAAPNLASLEQIHWPHTSDSLPRHHWYWDDPWAQRQGWARAEGSYAPQAWLDSDMLSDTLKEWLRANCVNNYTHLERW